MARCNKFAITAIMGNEERWVEQWSRSALKANPDYIVINLTQYNDKTEELLKKYIPEDKLILVKYPWAKSFSEARNNYLKHVPEDVDYCFFLDSDEILVEKAYKVIEDILSDPGLLKLFITTIYNATGDGSTNLTASLVYPRFHPHKIPNRKTLLNEHFDGEVHNQLIIDPKYAFEVIRPSNLAIYHYGYALDQESMKKKHARSEELLRNQVAENSNNYFAQLNLAQLLRAKGDIPGTLEAATNVIRIVENKLNEQGPWNAYVMAKEQLATCALAQKRFDDAIALSQEALNKKPDHLDSIMNMAVAYLEKQNPENAEFWFKRYLFIRSRYDETRDSSNLILNHLNSSFLALYHLGIINRVQGKLDKAEEYFYKSYQEEPEFGDVFVRYLDCLMAKGDNKRISKSVDRYMHEHSAKGYLIYEYFGDQEMTDTNIEAAKFNYYQAVHTSPDSAPEKKRIENKWKSLSSFFGEVASQFFDTSKKFNELKAKMS